MKTKFLSIFIIATLLSTSMAAQNTPEKDFKRHEISLGYGVIPFSDIFLSFGHLFSAPFVGKNNKITSVTSDGAFNAEYGYHLTKMIAITGEISYNRNKYTVVNKYTNEVVTNAYTDFVTTLAGVKFDWVNRKHFAFYSRVGLGVTLFSNPVSYISTANTSPSAVIMFQASPVGLEGGTSFLRAYTEVGMGQNGLISFGIRARF